MTATYVVRAESGITHDGRRYPKGAQVQLDGHSAAYHVRHGTVQLLDTGRRKNSKGDRNG